MSSLLLKLIFLFCLFLFVLNVNGISQNSDREIGVSMYGLGGDFNLIYKKNLAKDLYKRINIGLANLSLSHTKDRTTASLELAYGAGRERRKPLSDRLEFLYGLQKLISFGIYFNDPGTNYVITPGIAFLAGLKYNINEKIYLTLEAFPGISASIALGEIKSLSATAGLNINAIDAGVVYRFRTN
jgi:hypothetical protein